MRFLQCLGLRFWTITWGVASQPAQGLSFPNSILVLGIKQPRASASASASVLVKTHSTTRLIYGTTLQHTASDTTLYPTDMNQATTFDQTALPHGSTWCAIVCTTYCTVPHYTISLESSVNYPLVQYTQIVQASSIIGP